MLTPNLDTKTTNFVLLTDIWLSERNHRLHCRLISPQQWREFIWWHCLPVGREQKRVSKRERQRERGKPLWVGHGEIVLGLPVGISLSHTQSFYHRGQWVSVVVVVVGGVLDTVPESCCNVKRECCCDNEGWQWHNLAWASIWLRLNIPQTPVFLCVHVGAFLSQLRHMYSRSAHFWVLSLSASTFRFLRPCATFPTHLGCERWTWSSVTGGALRLPRELTKTKEDIIKITLNIKNLTARLKETGTLLKQTNLRRIWFWASSTAGGIVESKTNIGYYCKVESKNRL